MRNQANLAILGGQPLRTAAWPKWPRSDASTLDALRDVLESGRWAVSGPATGNPSYGHKFEAAFADYNDIAHCIATASGSTAIRIALESLEIGIGCEVLTPGLTWVACGSAILSAGAVPVFVDVDPRTLCMSLEAARDAVTARTAAVLLVHSFCSVADLDGFKRLCDAAGLALIEDCAQAHGALYRGQRVGTFGAIGVFSMQQTKVLTSGEGGAAITSSALLADRLQQLRSDGRRERLRAMPGEESLVEIGSVQGHNYCLSEFQCAILHDRLMVLDDENRERARNAAYLDRCLRELSYASSLVCERDATCPTYYKYCIRIDREAFAGLSVDAVADALAAEVGLRFSPTYDPIPTSVLYRPLQSRLVGMSSELKARLDPGKFDLPESVAARSTVLTFPHPALLERTGMDDIVSALDKVSRHAETLRHA